MTATHAAEFRFVCPYAEMLYAILAPEVASDSGEKSHISLMHDEASVTVTVEADDAVSLRATLNMWLRLVNVCKEVLEL